MGMLKNSIIISIGTFVMAILNFLFHVYVGRVLSPAEYGVFGALMALFLLIALPAGAISTAIMKFTAEANDKKEYKKIGLIRKKIFNKAVFYGIIAFLIIIALSVPLMNYLKLTSFSSIAIVGFTFIFAMILPVNRGILLGMKKFKEYSINNVIESVSRLVLVIILLTIGFKSNAAIFVYGLGYLIAFIIIFTQIKETKINKYESKEKINLKPFYYIMFIVLLSNLFIQAIINVPTLLIKHYASSEFTGFWNAALNLARVSLFVTGSIALVMFPEIAEKKEDFHHKKTFRKALALTLIAGFLFAIFVAIFSKLIITILYGNPYLPAVPILSWLGFAMIPLGLLQLWINYRIAKL